MNLFSIPSSPGIYRITCVPTGEIYVGASADMSKRASSHVSSLASGTNSARKLQEACDVHGLTAFVFDVLDGCDLEELSTREEAWIVRLAPAMNSRVHGGRVPGAVGLDHIRTYSQQLSGVSHADRQAARRKMAEECRAGKTMREVAAFFKVSAALVCHACKEHRVSRKRGRPKTAALPARLTP